MNVSVTSSTRGEVRHLTISISASEGETLDLIDSLSLAGGYPELIAGRITDTVGLVNIRSDRTVDRIRTLRQIADAMERELR